MTNTGLKQTYRVYMCYKDKNGKVIDFKGVPSPFDIYRIIQAESVKEVVEEFYKIYPDWRVIGVAGTADLTEDLLIKWIEWQGLEPKFHTYKSLEEIL